MIGRQMATFSVYVEESNKLKMLRSLICAEAQKFSEDGYEQHMQVNHLAPALLSVLLLPSLIRGSPSRIINVNSVVSSMITDSAISKSVFSSFLYSLVWVMMLTRSDLFVNSVT